MGGQLHFVFEAIGAATQYVKNGRLRPLGISTLKRSAILPDIPTISEAGVPGYQMVVWHTVCAPAGTPAPIIAKLNREIVAGINEPDTRDRFIGLGTEVVGSTPEEARQLIAQEQPRWQKLIRELNIQGN